MKSQYKPQMVEAVMFFNHRGICKEMLYPEFEAVLDRVVHLKDFADQQVRVVYVLIDPRLHIRAAVFFLIDFDAEGNADTGWNMPLRHMADQAGRGPDLGGGPIRLACRSQCPVSWHQMHMWDPNLKPGQSDLALLRDAARRNNLGLLAEDPPPTPAAAVDTAKTVDFEHRQRTALLIRQQRLRLNSLVRQHEEELARLRLAGEQQQILLRQEVDDLQQALAQQELLSASLKQRLQSQGEGFQKAREELSRQLRLLETHERSETEVLRGQFEVEMQARIAAAVADYKEQLSVLEVELSYRNELDNQMQEEIDRLKRERDQLAAQDDQLQSLAKLGVMFVAYHPGAGHLTISAQDIARYQQDPQAYVAAKCFVSTDHYRDWLEHYQNPACSGMLTSGERCGMPVDRVDTPSRFVREESNCCSRHKASARARIG